MKKILTVIMIGIILAVVSTGMVYARDNDKKSHTSPKRHYPPKKHQDADSSKTSLAQIQAQILALQAQLDELQRTPGPKGADGKNGADGAKGSKGDKGDKGDSCTVDSDSVSVTISCEDGTSAEIVFIPEENEEPGGAGGPGFLSCVDNWCLQQGTSEQYTSCESASADGFTCNNPEIRYGSVEGGIPAQDSRNDLNQWCQQLGFAASTGVTYGYRSVAEPFGQLFGCSSFDESAWHWCDYQNGFWYNESLDYHSVSPVPHITSITCSN